MDQAAAKRIATAQIAGTRDYQEDMLAVHVLKTGVHAGEQLLVLADGMGGHVGGDVASRLVVEHFSEAYINGAGDIPDILRSSLNIANEQLANAVEESPKLRGMGTTLIGCAIREDQLYWISVGDSPLWLCRDGALQRLNADHSMMPLLNDMVRTGAMDREEALVDVRRHMLRSAVAGKTIELIDMREEPWLLQAGDIVILASDGVETLADDELATLLSNPNEGSLQDFADKLMARIEAVGDNSQDNASVILYRH
jgi:serine/threonine protein phosphatase PrpC